METSDISVSFSLSQKLPAVSSQELVRAGLAPFGLSLGTKPAQQGDRKGSPLHVEKIRRHG